MKKLFWFDTETSGTDPKKHQILTLAIVVTDTNYQILDILDIKIKPVFYLEMDPGALAINGLNPTSQEFLEGALTELEALNSIEQFYIKNQGSEHKFIGHNVKFDQEFLFEAFARNQYSNFLSNEYFLDTLPYFRKLVKQGLIKTVILKARNGLDYASSKLVHLAEALKTQAEGMAHTALTDTLTLVNTYRAAAFLDNGSNNFIFYSTKK